MDDEPATEQSTPPTHNEYPRYIQLKFCARESDAFEQVKAAKEEHGLDWKEMVTFAAITLADQEIETSGSNIARALKELSK